MNLTKVVETRWNKSVAECSNEELYIALLEMTKELAHEKESNAGFVFCNGMFKEIPKGSISASSGYVVLQATLGEQGFTAEYKITTNIEPTQEKGYYVLGKVQSATGGGGYQVFQYYHSTPHIIICGECEQQKEQA